MQDEPNDGKKSGGRMWLWMIVCCVPMIAVFVLVALGYWTIG